MSDDRSVGADDGGAGADWPVDLRGVTEAVVTTLGPNDRWNVAALGLHAGDPITAKTYGRTRTWRNFREHGEGYVQFTTDPVDYAEAALSIREEADPVLDSADAWVRVAAERRDAADDHGTRVVTWALEPIESALERERVPTINRGHAAVVEATVAASRLDVDAFDSDRLLDRLAYCADVIGTCGGERERAALERIETLVDAEWAVGEDRDGSG